MSEVRENYQELLNSVNDAYKTHTQFHLTDSGKEMYLSAQDRYGGKSYITLTEEQVVELARGVKDRLDLALRNLDPYIEDYDYFRKQESNDKEAP